MKKQTIRLNENQLHKLIKESVKKVLNEIGDTPQGQQALGALAARQAMNYDKTHGYENFPEFSSDEEYEDYLINNPDDHALNTIDYARKANNGEDSKDFWNTFEDNYTN